MSSSLHILGLPAPNQLGSLTGSCDVTLQVTVKGQTKQTEWLLKKLNPKWDEKLVFDIEAKSSKDVIFTFDVRSSCLISL